MLALSDGVLLAFAAIISATAAGVLGVITLVLTRWLDGRAARQKAELDSEKLAAQQAREDLVAARVQAAADALILNQQKTAEQSKILAGKVDVVHGLVNTEKTEGKKTQLVLHKVNLRLLKKDPDSTSDEIAVAESNIRDLETEIAARLKADAVAQAKVELIAVSEAHLTALEAAPPPSRPGGPTDVIHAGDTVKLEVPEP